MNISLSSSKNNKSSKRGIIFRYILLVIFVIPMVLPLLWLLSTALKSNTAVFSIPPHWIPKEFQFSNFKAGFDEIDFGTRALNTFIIAIFSVIGQVISSIMVGYSLSRLKFPGRKIWFYLIVGSMMLPSMVSILPLFHLYSKLGWYNTWLPLIVPNFFGAPFYIFMTRQFMSTIPISFDEAAKIDGANHLQVLLKVIAPLCKPLIATIVVLQFQVSWNDYLTPLIYLNDPKKWTLSVAMGQFIGQYAVKWNEFMAADLLYMLPMLILFFLAQNYFMQGLGSINSSGIK